MSRTGSAGVGPAGFAARLEGACIADLVQLNCLNRTHGTFEIQSGQERGYLYFKDGQVFHAELGSEQGVGAFERLLALESGVFRPCARRWPTRASITIGWQALLLQAAQRQDESGPREPPSLEPCLVGLPSDAPHSQSPASDESEPQPTSAVRIDAHGRVESQHGPQAEALAETAAYLEHLMAELGDELGLGLAVAVDARAGEERGVLLYRKRDGQWLGLLGGSQALAALRTRIGVD